MPVSDNILFKISKLEHDEGLISATLDIYVDCDIFKGHFPDRPIVPGACMLQIVKEVLEKSLNTNLLLKKADHLKFLVMVEPRNIHTVVLDIAYKYIEDGDVSANAKLSSGDVVCFKFQGRFVIQSSVKN